MEKINELKKLLELNNSNKQGNEKEKMNQIFTSLDCKKDINSSNSNTMISSNKGTKINNNIADMSNMNSKTYNNDDNSKLSNVRINQHPSNTNSSLFNNQNSMIIENSINLKKNLN